MMSLLFLLPQVRSAILMASTCPPPMAPQEILMAINMGTQGFSKDSMAEEGPTTSTAPPGDPNMLAATPMAQQGGLMEIPTELRGPTNMVFINMFNTLLFCFILWPYSDWLWSDPSCWHCLGGRNLKPMYGQV